MSWSTFLLLNSHGWSQKIPNTPVVLFCSTQVLSRYSHLLFYPRLTLHFWTCLPSIESIWVCIPIHNFELLASRLAGADYLVSSSLVASPRDTFHSCHRRLDIAATSVVGSSSDKEGDSHVWTRSPLERLPEGDSDWECLVNPIVNGWLSRLVCWFNHIHIASWLGLGGYPPNVSISWSSNTHPVLDHNFPPDRGRIHWCFSMQVSPS